MTEQIATSSNPSASRPREVAHLFDFLTFLGRKLLNIALTLLAIIFIAYVGLGMVQGLSTLESTQEALPKTFAYVGRLLQGDLGTSQRGLTAGAAIPVRTLLPTMLINSLGLLGIALSIAIMVGIPWGIIAGIQKDSKRSLRLLLLATIGISTPSFFLLLLLQRGALYYRRTFDSTLLPVGGFGWDKHLILPVIVLAARPIAQITRMTLTAVRDNLEQDFVRMAHSKGLTAWVILWRHVLRNAGIPILTTISLSLRFSLSSLPVVETFFGWPGAGLALLTSIQEADEDLTIILLLSLGGIFIVINFLLDIIYRRLDPRLRDRPTYVGQGWGRIQWQSILSTLRDWIRRNPFLRSRWQQPMPTLSLPHFADQIAQEVPAPPTNYRRKIKQFFSNIPLLIGITVVIGLAILYVFGPDLAPHSPYEVKTLAKIDDRFYTAPFAPNSEYPWGTDGFGRDIQSMVFAGAQQTLTLALIVVVLRIATSFILGTLAGWYAGSWFDRFILTLIEVMSAFPNLLLVMLAILAIGIEKGMETFVIAFCLVGWGEITQMIRSEAATIRLEPYIESAVATGQTTVGMMTVHMLPNLAPTLVSLAALETGSVLMLLGELAFIGVFIGGGTTFSLDLFSSVSYGATPEWGAMLSVARSSARVAYWIALYPALAFFIAIMGFNLLGEGIHRIVSRGGFVFSQWFNRYTAAFAVVVIAGTLWWGRGNIGSIAFYRQDAAQFNAENALQYAETLTQPDMMGRALGSEGLELAHQYLATNMRTNGAQAAAERFSYSQAITRSYQTVDAVPQLIINNVGTLPRYRQDYAEYPAPFLNVGTGQGQVRFIGLNPSAEGATAGYDSIFAGKDFSQDILLILSDWELRVLQTQPHQGILMVADDPYLIQQRFTLSPLMPPQPDTPIMWITEELANHLLADTGQTVAALRERREALAVDAIIDIPTNQSANLAIVGSAHENVPAFNIVGMVPGDEPNLAGKIIVIMAPYDTPALGADGMIEGAIDNAGGVGILMEMLRTIKESGYVPFKSLLFVAYSEEGLENNELLAPHPHVRDFLSSRDAFSSFDIEAVIYLRGLGMIGTGALVASAGQDQWLLDMADTAAEWVDVPLISSPTVAYRPHPSQNYLAIEQIEQASDILNKEREDEYAIISLSQQGWEQNAGISADTFKILSLDNIQNAGETATLIVMVLGREIDY